MKLYRILENEQQIEQALEQVEIDGNYEITPNGIDVNGNVVIPLRAKQIPVQFNIVTGDFECSRAKITSLRGAPREVGGQFDCSFTYIAFLEGRPREVGGDFDCSFTKITSLHGAPIEVGGDFVCVRTKITSLQGAPREVGGDFVCFFTKMQGKPDTSDIDIGGDLIWK